MIKLEDKVENLDKLLDKSDANNSVTYYTFEPDSKVQKIIDDPTSVGKLCIKYIIRPPRSPSTTTSILNNTSAQDRVAQSAAATTTDASIARSSTTPVLKETSGQPPAEQVAAATATTTPIENSFTAHVLQTTSEQSPAEQSAATTDASTTSSTTTDIPNTKSEHPSENQSAASATAASVANSTTAPVLNVTPAQSSAAKSVATATAAPIAKNPKHMKAVLVDGIKVRTNSDTSKCCISGSVLLPGNKLILVDCENNKLKLLNLQTSKVTSGLRTTSPWNITSISADQVAVTLHFSRKIAFVKVTDTLKIDREMPVARECSAISHNNGKLIVSFTKPNKIEIMALDGTIEREIERFGVFKGICRMALSLDCKSIYIADSVGGYVKKITLDGVVEAVYRDNKLCNPSALAIDQHGRVLVCGENSYNIHLLTPHLTKVKVLADESDKPLSISFCYYTSTLFVGMESDNVNVYQLS